MAGTHHYLQLQYYSVGAKFSKELSTQTTAFENNGSWAHLKVSPLHLGAYTAAEHIQKYMFDPKQGYSALSKNLTLNILWYIWLKQGSLINDSSATRSS